MWLLLRGDKDCACRLGTAGEDLSLSRVDDDASIVDRDGCKSEGCVGLAPREEDILAVHVRSNVHSETAAGLTGLLRSEKASFRVER